MGYGVSTKDSLFACTSAVPVLQWSVCLASGSAGFSFLSEMWSHRCRTQSCSVRIDSVHWTPDWTIGCCCCRRNEWSLRHWQCYLCWVPAAAATQCWSPVCPWLVSQSQQSVHFLGPLTTHVKCEADKMKGSWDMWVTYRQTYLELVDVVVDRRNAH